MKKQHWTQTLEGKKRMAKIQRKRWRESRTSEIVRPQDVASTADDRPTSKAEKLIRRKMKKSATNGTLGSSNRREVYNRAATLAAVNGEWSLLLRAYFQAGTKHLAELQQFIERSER